MDASEITEHKNQRKKTKQKQKQKQTNTNKQTNKQKKKQANKNPKQKEDKKSKCILSIMNKKLHLSTELSKVVTSKKFQKLTLRALALCQSEPRNYGLCVVYMLNGGATLLGET